MHAEDRMDELGRMLGEVDLAVSPPGWSACLPAFCPNCGAVMLREASPDPDLVRWSCTGCCMGGTVVAPADRRDPRYSDWGACGFGDGDGDGI